MSGEAYSCPAAEKAGQGGAEGIALPGIAVSASAAEKAGQGDTGRSTCPDPKILLFGGTFDPPHAGHLHNLAAAIRTVGPDKVIVMPAGIPPHKAASATPAGLRLEMCRCFEALSPAVEISDWEIRQGGKSYTIDTVRMLARRFGGAALYLCIGSDMLLSFRGWRCWQELLALVILVVQSREEGDAGALAGAAEELRAAGGRVLFTDAPPLPMASSEIRAAGAAGQSLPLPPLVEEIARQHHLFGR